MHQSRRSRLVYRILSGKVKLLNKYYFIYPNIDILYDAQILYDKTIENCRFDELLSKSQVSEILISKGLWSVNGDSNLREIEKNIENLKVQLYESRLNSKNQNNVRKTLKLVKEKFSETFQKKHYLDSYTVEGYAESVKTNFIYKKCLVNLDFNPVNPKNILFTKLINTLNNLSIIDIQYRELARTEPWRGYWNPYKSPAVFDLFGDNKKTHSVQMGFGNFTIEQQNLVAYTKMYDGIYENPDCPEDSIIKDDDVLDGWMIYIKRKREQEQKSKSLEKDPIMSKHPHAQEIFIPVSSKEDADKVNELNTIRGKMIKKERDAIIKERGSVRDIEFPDKKQEVLIQQNKQFVDKVRGIKNG